MMVVHLKESRNIGIPIDRSNFRKMENNFFESCLSDINGTYPIRDNLYVRCKSHIWELSSSR